jgi:hypothetical protein
MKGRVTEFISRRRNSSLASFPSITRLIIRLDMYHQSCRYQGEDVGIPCRNVKKAYAHA